MAKGLPSQDGAGLSQIGRRKIDVLALGGMSGELLAKTVFSMSALPTESLVLSELRAGGNETIVDIYISCRILYPPPFRSKRYSTFVLFNIRCRRRYLASSVSTTCPIAEPDYLNTLDPWYRSYRFIRFQAAMNARANS